MPTRPPKHFDIDLSFRTHPVTKDILTVSNSGALRASIRNLLLTNKYERPYKPRVATNLTALLFEPLLPTTALSIRFEVERIIRVYEPRAEVKSIVVTPNQNNDGFDVSLEYAATETSEVASLNIFLERRR